MRLQFYLFSQLFVLVFGKYELIFVHTIWRHGDRSPDGHLNNDPIDPSQWIFGGGGYGQLTTQGMAQQFLLGKQLRQRYIERDFPNFLHPFYDSKEIFIRSTDTNRTLNSAIANMLGMFLSDTSRPGIDYPDIAGWPKGFMPVPIHSPVPSNRDCTLHAFCKCKRRNEIFAIAESGEQFQSFLKDPDYLSLCEQLSKLFDDTYTWENLWLARDALQIQQLHFPEVLHSQPWYSEEFYQKLLDVSRKTALFAAGLYDPPVINGTNVRKEILKFTGGLLANEISARMRTKYNCVKNPEKCDSYHKLLKYYAYSAHDHSLMAILAVFELETVIAGPEKYGQWPEYAADLTFELFVDTTSNISYFRAVYKRSTNETFEVVTNRIKGCKNQEYCELKVFENRAKEYRIDQPIEEYCQTSINSSKSTPIIFVFLVFCLHIWKMS